MTVYLFQLCCGSLITALSGAVITCLWLLVKWAITMHSAVIAALRKNIVDIYQSGKTTSYDIEEMNRLYDLYHRLGGNGYIDSLVAEIKGLRRR